MKAAGAQITHSWHGEVVTRNSNKGLTSHHTHITSLRGKTCLYILQIFFETLWVALKDQPMEPRGKTCLHILQIVLETLCVALKDQPIETSGS